VSYRVHAARRGIYFVGPTPAEPNRRRSVWTQSQDQDARYWFPALDYPDEKFTTSTTVIVPRGLFALANGALEERRDDGETTVFRYEQRVPHVTYLVTMVAGEFAEVEQSARVPMWFYVNPARRDDGERAFGKTPKMLEVFERTIGYDYPYERYSQIAVSDFIFGGMENTSATTQTDRTLHDERAHLDFSSDSLVAHELAHQWFGDLLTCRDWSQAWLNESFATFFETVFREADLGWDEYLADIAELVADYVKEDAERYRRPIVTNVYRDPIELFDRHLYQKGGAVLHMLRGELGWDRMRRSLRRYVADNAMRNVETIDLIRAIEAVTGRNMRAFFDRWIYGEGHPELEIAYRYDREAKVAFVDVRQTQPIDDDHPPFRFDVYVGVVPSEPSSIARDFGDGPLPGEQRVRLRVERESATAAFRCDGDPALVRFDPGAYILGTVSYKFSADAAARTLRSDPDPIARTRAAGALAKDGSRVAREALVRSLAAEPFWAVAAAVVDALATTHAPFARNALTEACAHPHPKVRRAIAEALGERHAQSATALLGLLNDPSYFVRAAALESLGKSRDPRAFEAILARVGEASWNDVVGAGALRGLGELADERAIAPLIASLAVERSESLRRAAIDGLARAANLLDRRRAEIVDALAPLFDDPNFFVRRSIIAAAVTIGDPAFLPSLDRIENREVDGSLKRSALEATMHIRESAKIPSEIERLRAEIDRLREESRSVREAVDSSTR